jgi:hypothetical protein
VSIHNCVQYSGCAQPNDRIRMLPRCGSARCTALDPTALFNQQQALHSRLATTQQHALLTEPQVEGHTITCTTTCIQRLASTARTMQMQHATVLQRNSQCSPVARRGRLRWLTLMIRASTPALAASRPPAACITCCTHIALPASLCSSWQSYLHHSEHALLAA